MAAAAAATVTQEIQDGCRLLYATTKVTSSVGFEWRIENFLCVYAGNESDELSKTWNIPEKNLKFKTHLLDMRREMLVVYTVSKESERALMFRKEDCAVQIIDKDERKLKMETWNHGQLKETHVALCMPSVFVNNPTRYLQDNTLVLQILVGIEYEEEESSKPPVNNNNGIWSERIKKSFTDGLYNTDVTLVCGEEQIKCHKYILGLCSDVLRSYFRDGNDTLENRTNTVTIEDTDPESVREFVKFIYTNELKEDYENVCQALSLANKYNVANLKLKCEDYLIKKITVDNVAELAFMGKFHNADELRNSVVDFIAKNKEVVEMDAWQKVAQQDPLTMMEIMKKAMAKMTAMS